MAGPTIPASRFGYTLLVMSPERDLPIRFENEGATLIAIVETATLMGDDAGGLGNLVLDELQRGGDGLRSIALDLGRVTTINSVTLGALVTLQTDVLRRGVEFGLIGVAAPIRKLLDATRLSSVFRIFDSRAAFLSGEHC
jgi:anti-anti-sigma factor